MDKTILIVEDEKALVMALQDRLESEGYQVDVSYNGKEGESKALKGSYSCIILDVMLPGMDGFQICNSLRREGIQTPILFLTARNTSIDTVLGLKLGADDYLAKPFDMHVLLARIEALLRRYPQQSKQSHIGFGPFVLDKEKQELRCNGKPIDINATEFQLLLYLVDHEGSTVSREKLLDDVWGYKLLVSTRTVDVHIARLRQKLNEGQIPTYIKTVRRMGYRFERG